MRDSQNESVRAIEFYSGIGVFRSRNIIGWVHPFLQEVSISRSVAAVFQGR